MLDGQDKSQVFSITSSAVKLIGLNITRGRDKYRVSSLKCLSAPNCGSTHTAVRRASLSALAAELPDLFPRIIPTPLDLMMVHAPPNAAGDLHVLISSAHHVSSQLITAHHGSSQLISSSSRLSSSRPAGSR